MTTENIDGKVLGEQSCFALVHASRPRSGASRSADALRATTRGAGIRIAIADGCSESPCGGAWAVQLCESAITDLAPSIIYGGFAQIYRHAQTHYRRPAPVSSRQARYMRQVPHDDATFLVADVDVEPGGSGVTVRAGAIGDTQILLLDPVAPPELFPLKTLAEFVPPDLLSSLDSDLALADRARAAFKQHLSPQTVFVVCTDEVARWLLSYVERGRLDELRYDLARALQHRDQLSALAESMPASLRADDDLTLGVFTLLPQQPGACGRPRHGTGDPLHACVAALTEGRPP
jgi:hypothetical protein